MSTPTWRPLCPYYRATRHVMALTPTHDGTTFSVLSFSILKQWLVSTAAGGGAKPRWGSIKGPALLGPGDPEGPAGAASGKGLWPGRGLEAP